MEIPIINLGYELYKELIITNDQLTKRWKYSLGTNLEATLLSFLEVVIMAKNAPKELKGSYLITSSSHLEILRLKLRLYLELKLLNETKVFQLQSRLDEIGRMLGGWMKATKSQ